MVSSLVVTIICINIKVVTIICINIKTDENKIEDGVYYTVALVVNSTCPSMHKDCKYAY